MDPLGTHHITIIKQNTTNHYAYFRVFPIYVSVITIAYHHCPILVSLQVVFHDRGLPEVQAVDTNIGTVIIAFKSVPAYRFVLFLVLFMSTVFGEFMSPIAPGDDVVMGQRSTTPVGPCVPVGFSDYYRKKAHLISNLLFACIAFEHMPSVGSLFFFRYMRTRSFRGIPVNGLRQLQTMLHYNVHSHWLVLNPW